MSLRVFRSPLLARLRFYLVSLLACGMGTVASAQVRTGAIRIHAEDPNGLAVGVHAELASGSNEVLIQANSDASGDLSFGSLPFGFYRLTVTRTGFSSIVRQVEVRSPIPMEQTLRLSISPDVTHVTVTDDAVLLDPYQPSSVAHIGAGEVNTRGTSLPGRSVQDLVNTQPGWLYEGNAVLHPRGAEYQTQIVLDGVPLTDNRSPGFGPEIEADDLDSLNIYTAGFPAEYGRKLGGVVELNTKTTPDPGLHGQLVLSGGSYATAQSFGNLQDTVGKNTFVLTASGSRSSHYLNPVVPDNFTNNGTTGDFAARFAHDFRETDRLSFEVRHELSRFEIPNEYVQESAGQLQTGDNTETLGTGHYSHTFSPNTLSDLSGFVRDRRDDLFSNAASTPILATQHNSFREGYLKGTFFTHLRNNDIKAGFESDNTVLHENFAYTITDPTQFDPGTPSNLPPYIQSRPDLEQAAFVEDLIRLGAWTVSAGLRWDHYQLLLNQNAFSPRLSLSRAFFSANTVLHASYDRIFQTPSNENILLSSSPVAQTLNPTSLGLPVQPSRGNYYEGGLTQVARAHVRTALNIFRRDVSNYADDDQLLNTGISYPIAFCKAILYGAEAKVELLQLARLSGYVSYSYIVGNAFAPVTGGLFLGNDATDAIAGLSGHFPDSQDQRNTVRTRFQYQAIRRFWVAGGLASNSGLPFDFDGTAQDALQNYGASVVNRLNFNRGRVDPSLTVNASSSVDLFQEGALHVRLQADGENLTDQLQVIDFGGLFSGNAIGPGRSYFLRLTTSF